MSVHCGFGASVRGSHFFIPTGLEGFGAPMAYDLTISRFGAIAGPPVQTSSDAGRLCDNKIIAAFQWQMKDMMGRRAFEKSHERIRDIAGGGEFLTDRPSEPLEVTTMPLDASEAVANDTQAPALIALLPSQRFQCKIDGMKWIVRARSSVTACALQQQNGVSKLWWSIEGIPADPDSENRPSESQVVAFVAKTDEMQKAGMKKLHVAFCESLRKTDRPPTEVSPPETKIQITMSDNDDRQLGALFDAIYFEGRNFDEIRAGTSLRLQRAKQGLDEFEDLVRDITHYTPEADGSTVSVKREALGLGLFYRHAGYKPRQTVVAGVARRTGVIPGFDFLSPTRKREEKSEDTLRTRSAARQISAVLAGEEMRALQKAPAL